MEYKNRESILDEMQKSLQPLMQQYDLDSIGIYEEQGEDENYYIGYSIEKKDNFFIINLPYVKNEQGNLAVKDTNWTIQLDDHEEKNIKSLDEVFNRIEENIKH
ncbi:DUF5634 family protein [Bacillus sp. Marseille-P3661]|uniref:DUF5634 family protein n=1 Tax=Bacillus sp. Marseille-P3661 TaxID=1936234 RepID=UPI000C84B65C|nr:DUF5634 family protein [Bacillus sp. Marseille-P3661]